MDFSTADLLTVQRFMERYAEEKELGFSKVCTVALLTVQHVVRQALSSHHINRHLQS